MVNTTFVAFQRVGGYSSTNGTIVLQLPFVFQDNTTSAVGTLSASNLGAVPLDYFPLLDDGTLLQYSAVSGAYVLIVLALALIQGVQSSKLLGRSLRLFLRLESSSVRKTVHDRQRQMRHQKDSKGRVHATASSSNSSAAVAPASASAPSASASSSAGGAPLLSRSSWTEFAAASQGWKWAVSPLTWLVLGVTCWASFCILPSHILVLLFESLNDGYDSLVTTQYDYRLLFAALGSSWALVLLFVLTCWQRLVAERRNERLIGSLWCAVGTVVLAVSFTLPEYLVQAAVQLPAARLSIDSGLYLVAPVVLLPLCALLSVQWVPLTVDALVWWALPVWSLAAAGALLIAQWVPRGLSMWQYGYLNSIDSGAVVSGWSSDQVWIMTSLLLGLGIFLAIGMFIHRNQFSVNVMDLQLAAAQTREAKATAEHNKKKALSEQLQADAADAQTLLMWLRHSRPGFRPVTLAVLSGDVSSEAQLERLLDEIRPAQSAALDKLTRVSAITERDDLDKEQQRQQRSDDTADDQENDSDKDKDRDAVDGAAEQQPTTAAAAPATPGRSLTGRGGPYRRCDARAAAVRCAAQPAVVRAPEGRSSARQAGQHSDRYVARPASGQGCAEQ